MRKLLDLDAKSGRLKSTANKREKMHLALKKMIAKKTQSRKLNLPN